MAKYTVGQQAVDTLLSWVKSRQIAIPEMQRPFVWDSTKVRDLLDSLYQGYPIGYLITWQSTDVGLKDGTSSGYKQILIDGQQRITAMTAALVGEAVVDKSYRKRRIKIAFNPATEAFATLTPVIEKDSAWISDVAEFINSASTYSATKAYLEANPDLDAVVVEPALQKLAEIKTSQVGIINLAEDLDIGTVTEIFIRINSKGVALSSADFAMSKIASHGEFGSNLRKLIDYFCRLAVQPHAYSDIAENDVDFGKSGYLPKIAWLREDASDLYDPQYTDVIRVAGMAEFGRGQLAALVSMLSGRDFETRSFSEQLAVQAFDRLESALLRIVNQYSFQQFTMTIKSAGFSTARLIGSKNALNFAYALTLILKQNGQMSDGVVKSIVRRWFVLSTLTGRYSNNVETTLEADIRRIAELGAERVLDELERSDLSDNFWQVTLPLNLDTSSTRAPGFLVFQAAQVHRNAKGFLSKNITVANMLDDQGDIHHLVPKNYLVANGLRDRSIYNQVANYALTETPINIAIKDRAPDDYMAIADAQAAGGPLRLGEISDAAALDVSLRDNAVPDVLRSTTFETYPQFLAERRLMMSLYIRDYYRSL